MHKKDMVIRTGGLKGKTSSFLLPVLISLGSHSAPARALIILPEPEAVAKAGRELRKLLNRNRINLRFALLISETSVKQELEALSGAPDIIIGTPARIIDHIRRENIDLSGIETAVVDTPSEPDGNGFEQDLYFIYSKLPERHQSVFYLQEHHEFTGLDAFTRKPITLEVEAETKQEKIRMKSERNNIDVSEIERQIRDFIRQIKEDEDPDSLNELKKLFKKNTPLGMRGYLSAFLLKQAMEGPRRRPRSSYTPSSGSNENNGSGSSEQLENKQTLFVSIGKNRRVYPKDLARLFQSNAEVPAGDIGGIKVLDSYSFVDISADFAPAAINKLDGTEYKGRKITVNYARKKSV